jgi:hypothetical protein
VGPLADPIDPGASHAARKTAHNRPSAEACEGFAPHTAEKRARALTAGQV